MPPPPHDPTTVLAQAPSVEADEMRLLAALREGDEAAFEALVERYHGALRRLARSFVPTEAVAEEVVQETWLGVLEGLDRFRGEASLKTWIFRILVNRAKTRGERERRSVPLSSIEPEGEEASVDPDRFQGPDRCWEGHWAVPPRPWQDPQRRLASLEARKLIGEAIGRLPAREKAVVTLRDVEGLSSEEVCELLELSEGNQRVILHRGRSRVRRELEGYVD